MIENALIESYYLGFEEIPAGQNFILILRYKVRGGGGQMKFNPLQIPLILKTLNIDDLSQIVGTYVRIDKYNEDLVPFRMQDILDDEKDVWIETDDRFLGDDFFIEGGDN